MCHPDIEAITDWRRDNAGIVEHHVAAGKRLFDTETLVDRLEGRNLYRAVTQYFSELRRDQRKCQMPFADLVDADGRRIGPSCAALIHHWKEIFAVLILWQWPHYLDDARTDLGRIGKRIRPRDEDDLRPSHVRGRGLR